MRPALLALALASAAGLALPLRVDCLPGRELLHPGFTLRRRDLPQLVAQLPQAAREQVTARPAEFLELMRGVLLGPADLLVLVDKTRGLDPGFVPPDLVALSRYPVRTGRQGLQLRAVLIPDLVAMAEAASAAGAPLVVSSAWRSFEYQQQLLERALATQSREEALRTLAPPGHSQHQLGTAMDFGSIDLSFARTPAGKWLAGNAWRHGFSLSYPEGLEWLTGYSWEPWHYRYVGKPAARLVEEFFAGRQQEFLEYVAARGPGLSERLVRRAASP
jgi:zinc D-Ala-D-Ala carboxypeptidase